MMRSHVGEGAEVGVRKRTAHSKELIITRLQSSVTLTAESGNLSQSRRDINRFPIDHSKVGRSIYQIHSMESNFESTLFQGALDMVSAIRLFIIRYLRSDPGGGSNEQIVILSCLKPFASRGC